MFETSKLRVHVGIAAAVVLAPISDVSLRRETIHESIRIFLFGQIVLLSVPVGLEAARSLHHLSAIESINPLVSRTLSCSLGDPSFVFSFSIGLELAIRRASSKQTSSDIANVHSLPAIAFWSSRPRISHKRCFSGDK